MAVCRVVAEIARRKVVPFLLSRSRNKRFLLCCLYLKALRLFDAFLYRACESRALHTAAKIGLESRVFIELSE